MCLLALRECADCLEMREPQGLPGTVIALLFNSNQRTLYMTFTYTQFQHKLDPPSDPTPRDALPLVVCARAKTQPSPHRSWTVSTAVYSKNKDTLSSADVFISQQHNCSAEVLAYHVGPKFTLPGDYLNTLAALLPEHTQLHDQFIQYLRHRLRTPQVTRQYAFLLVPAVYLLPSFIIQPAHYNTICATYVV
jgi:hypothetical protein